jgi:hypothetical protein
MAAHTKLADNHTAINRLDVGYGKIIKSLQVHQIPSSIVKKNRWFVNQNDPHNAFANLRGIEFLRLKLEGTGNGVKGKRAPIL